AVCDGRGAVEAQASDLTRQGRGVVHGRAERRRVGVVDRVAARVLHGGRDPRGRLRHLERLAVSGLRLVVAVAVVRGLVGVVARAQGLRGGVGYGAVLGDRLVLGAVRVALPVALPI